MGIKQEAITTPPPAALQFADCIIRARYNSMRGAEPVFEYQRQKARLAASIHNIPDTTLGALLTYAVQPRPDGSHTVNLIIDTAQGKGPPLSSAVKLALVAATQRVDPFPGLLAFSPLREELPTWRVHRTILWECAESYGKATLGLLACLLSISFPALANDAISGELFIAMGLPAEEPNEYDNW